MTTDGSTGNYLKSGLAFQRGQLQQAANVSRGVLGQLDFASRQPTMTDATGWQLFLDESIADWCVYTDSSYRRAVVNEATFDTLGFHGPAMSRFSEDFLRDGAPSGMKFLTLDGPYREAARLRAEADGAGVVRGKDALTALAEQANSLLVQAASLNERPSQAQQQLFFVRYTEMRRDLEAAEHHLAAVRSLINLAGSAIVEACA